jgi:hypothetical protein
MFRLRLPLRKTHYSSAAPQRLDRVHALTNGDPDSLVDNANSQETRLLARRACDVQFDARVFLQVSDHIEEIARLRVPARPEHPNETFWLGAGRTPEFLEAHRRFDVIAEDRLPGLNVPREKQVNSPAKQGFRKLGIGSNVILNEFLKTSGRYFRPGFFH